MEAFLLPGLVVSIVVIIILLFLLLRDRVHGSRFPGRGHRTWPREFPRIEIHRKKRDLSVIHGEVEREILMLKARSRMRKSRTGVDDILGRPGKRKR